MNDHRFEVRFELDGWDLFFAVLSRESADAPSLDSLRESVTAGIRERFTRETLKSHPPVAALRRLFKNAGCDPTRYRPSSEALLRRLLKGDPLPAISTFVDLNNCLSSRLAVPCCVMAKGSFTPPFVFRAGGTDETYESFKGPFRLEGKPLLVDQQGPCDAPITGNERVRVSSETAGATLLAYLPKGVVSPLQAREELEGLVAKADAVSLQATGTALGTAGA